MLPEYIPIHIAESILFAGKAIRVLRNPSLAVKFQGALPHQQIQKGSQRVPGLIGRPPQQKESSVQTILTGEELLPQTEADKIEAMLQDLKVLSYFEHLSANRFLGLRKHYRLANVLSLFLFFLLWLLAHLFPFFFTAFYFSSFIMCRNHLSSIRDHLRLQLTQLKLLPLIIFGRCLLQTFIPFTVVEKCSLLILSHLQLIVVRADLNGHLKALKDYFLLAKGDFFQVMVNDDSGSYFVSVANICIFVMLSINCKTQ